MMDAQNQAMFAVDCNGKLAIDTNGKSLALEAGDVLRMMDFLGSITYKGLVRRTDGSGQSLASAGGEA